jgi:GTP cyclohydrolase I
LTIEGFKDQYPEQSLKSPFTCYLNGYKSKNRTYSEIYGEDRSAVMKQKRKESASIQMQDPLQKSVRSEKLTGLQRSEDEIEKSVISINGDVDLNYREKALSYYGEECAWCGESEVDRLIVHHKDGNNFGNNIFTNNDVDNLVVLCRSCHGHVHSQEKKGYWEGKSQIEKGFAQVISGLYTAYGFDKDDINVRDTPSRVARAYLEMLQGIDPSRAEAILKQNFPSEYDGMVVIAKIPCFSMCPHHFLPVKYEASFGYIPNGNVLGLSKIPRYIKTSVQAPVLQEDITEQIVERFSNIVKPLGCMVILKGNHMCMGCRGIEMPDTSTVTSAFRGNFENQVVRDEFFTMIGFHK